MRIYLVQHAEAKVEEEDPNRPLTKKGREDISKVARFAAAYCNVKVDKILHSGKTRAAQTAEVLAEHLHPAGGVEEVEGLAPLDDPRRFSELVESMQEDVMVVGHLPHLARLAGLLLCGNAERRPVAFTMAGIVALERGEKGGWSVEWLITPPTIP